MSTRENSDATSTLLATLNTHATRMTGQLSHMRDNPQSHIERVERFEHLSETSLGLGATCCTALCIWLLLYPVFSIIGMSWIQSVENDKVIGQLDTTSTTTMVQAATTLVASTTTVAASTTTASALASATTPQVAVDNGVTPTKIPASPAMGVAAIIRGVVQIEIPKTPQMKEANMTDPQKMNDLVTDLTPVVMQSLMEFFKLPQTAVSIDDASALLKAQGQNQQTIQTTFNYEADAEDGGAYETRMQHAQDFNALVKTDALAFHRLNGQTGLQVASRASINYWGAGTEAMEHPTHKVDDEGHSWAA